MKEERTTPLRQRMIEDMRIRGMAEKTQAAHIRAVKDFAIFLKRSPDTATPEELRAYQLHMTNAGMSATTFNVRIVSLRFFFGSAARKANIAKVRSLLGEAQPEATPQAADAVTPHTLREPCPCCGGPMRIVEIFRRGQKPQSRAPPSEQAA